MENTQQNQDLKTMVARVDVTAKFEALLGEKTPAFISSMLQIVSANTKLQAAEPVTILNAAATAAALDLPINQNLGFAWIVPYYDKRTRKTVAQFQMGWKGYVQLAHRTKQYNKMTVVKVYKSQYKSWNAMTEFLDCDWNAEPDGEVVGYACYFRLLNGFDKFVYWTKERVVKHAGKYSQSYGQNWSSWKSHFDEMAMKTVLKNTLAKWGVLSVEMETAQLADQSVQLEEGAYNYLDNPKPAAIDVKKVEEDKEKERIIDHISRSETIEQLLRVKLVIKERNDTALGMAYDAKELKLKKKDEFTQ